MVGVIFAFQGWDHPREYGENHLKESQAFHAPGPSPRIRGKLHARDLLTITTGTIPANTGKMLT